MAPEDSSCQKTLVVEVHEKRVIGNFEFELAHYVTSPPLRTLTI